MDLEIVEPNPFTVFVGPNGSGKSNIFEALEFAYLLTAEDNLDKKLKIENNFGGEESFLNKKEANKTSGIIYMFDNSNGFLFLRQPKSDEIIDFIKKMKNEVEQLHEQYNDLIKTFAKEKGTKIPNNFFLGTNTMTTRLEKFLSTKYNNLSFGIPLYDEFLTSTNNDFVFNKEILAKILSSFNDIAGKPGFAQFITGFSRIFVGKRTGDNAKFLNHLRSDASNLDKILYRILKDEGKRDEIIELLQLFIPEFENIEFRRSQINGKAEMKLFEKFSSEPFDKALISDGTYNILALLAAVYQSDEPQFLCIEEPENGLHPEAIKELVGFFRTQCEDKGHYIWLNTHSQSLVSALQPHEVILVNKREGQTQIKQLKGKDLHGLGMDEAWLSNALGGGLTW